MSCDVQDEIVFIDKLRLEQVELNLLSNALKFTPEGGSVSYTVRQMGPAENGRATYAASVKDTGIGMSPDFVRRVFDPFEREHTSTANGIPGTGLGLSIAQKIIEHMGGTITCASQLGVGTEFTFVITCNVGSPADLPGKAPTNVSISDFSGKRVLLVEDNELNREIAYEILVDFGFSVDTAEDGDIAVEKVAASSPGYYDLILMDVQMPRMDGYQAAEAIRAMEDPDLASIPIIAFTANAFDEDQNRAYMAGMNGHLAKPINVSKLIESLTHFL